MINRAFSAFANVIKPLFPGGRRRDQSPSLISSPSDDSSFPFKYVTESLSRGHEEYWAEFRRGPFACLVFDLDTLEIVSAMDLASQAFGFAQREMETRDLSVVWPKEEFPKRFEFIQRTRALESGDSGEPVPFRTHQGREVWSRFSFRNIEYAGRNLRVVFFADLPH